MSEFEPTPGSLIWTDFDPRTGREQGGRRPALVVSPKPLFSASRFIIVCPITSSGFKDPPSIERMLQDRSCPIVDLAEFRRELMG